MPSELIRTIVLITGSKLLQEQIEKEKSPSMCNASEDCGKARRARGAEKGAWEIALVVITQKKGNRLHKSLTNWKESFSLSKKQFWSCSKHRLLRIRYKRAVFPYKTGLSGTVFLFCSR